VAAALGVLHFLWLVKRDVTEPAIAGLVLVLLLIFRLPRRRPKPSAVAATETTAESAPLLS
jgi:sulfoxide reductase heme-binding subunit YedZ